MPTYKIIYNRKDCIGAAACVAMSEKYWRMNNDNKADLKSGILNQETGFYELEISEENLNEALESARVCPVEVIMIEKIENNKITRLFPEQ